MVLADRAPLSGAEARRIVEAIWRLESAPVTAALARLTGDLVSADDLAHEALTEALRCWPRDGVPSDPTAWLLAVGRRRAHDLVEPRPGVQRPGLHRADEPSPSRAPATVDDDLLALLFIVCHPLLTASSRVTLMLRMVAGLTVDEIARELAVPAVTIHTRIALAKRTLTVAAVPFTLPSSASWARRLESVLTVLHEIFAEGAMPLPGDDPLQPLLADEARRIARTLVALVPGETAAHELLALMELTAARFPARHGPDGEVILLEHQDRRRWDRLAIARGRAQLRWAAATGRGPGAYGLQAAVAACHAAAPSPEATDWSTIVQLYEALGRLTPGPTALDSGSRARVLRRCEPDQLD